MLSSIVTSIGWTMVPAAGARNEENRSVTNPNCNSSGLCQASTPVYSFFKSQVANRKNNVFFPTMFFLLYRAAASGSQVCKAGLRPQLPNHSHTHLYNSYLYSSYPSSYGRFILITHILTHTHFHISHPQFNEEQIYICYISHFLFCCVFPDPPLLLTAAFDLPNYSLVCFCSTEHRFKCFPKSCSFAH